MTQKGRGTQTSPTHKTETNKGGEGPKNRDEHTKQTRKTPEGRNPEDYENKHVGKTMKYKHEMKKGHVKTHKGNFHNH